MTYQTGWMGPRHLCVRRSDHWLTPRWQLPYFMNRDIQATKAMYSRPPGLMSARVRISLRRFFPKTFLTQTKCQQFSSGGGIAGEELHIRITWNSFWRITIITSTTTSALFLVPPVMLSRDLIRCSCILAQEMFPNIQTWEAWILSHWESVAQNLCF